MLHPTIASPQVSNSKQMGKTPGMIERLVQGEKVKDVMLHAWTSYEKHAWGFDQLQTKNGVDTFGGLGVTIVDSLDTLFIMGLDEQFKRARDWVATSLNFNKNYDASVFETTIRMVGGLVSAHDLSGDKVFLEKATDIADRLLPAWNTPSGINYNIVNLATGHAQNYASANGNSILAEVGTNQLEFIALSQRTNQPKYQEKVEKVIEVLHKNFPADGLVPMYINPQTGKPYPSLITFGAQGNSFYEYLLKVWIQGNKTQAVNFYREMWETSMGGLQSLVRKSTPSSYAYICEKNGNALVDQMNELACFASGMLALGSSGFDPKNAKTILSLAEEIGKTYYNFYRITRTKISRRGLRFLPLERTRVLIVRITSRGLKPSSRSFTLWRFTGNKMYREWGWEIFQAFEKNSRLDRGYIGLTDVNTGAKDNSMQSFFLAETLKYLYLLFSPPSVIPLDEWVFNTEAHPLKIVPRINSRSKSEHVLPARLGGMM